VVDLSTWSPPPIFDLVSTAAGVPRRDLFGVLNMGIGLVVVVRAQDQEQALTEARTSGTDPVILGTVVEGQGVRLE
jgi:phosphoribosylformylglycinamidine cyclo-ligase